MSRPPAHIPVYKLNKFVGNNSMLPIKVIIMLMVCLFVIYVLWIMKIARAEKGIGRFEEINIMVMETKKQMDAVVKLDEDLDERIKVIRHMLDV